MKFPAALLVLLLAPALSAQMRMLRPLPVHIADADRAQLASQRAEVARHGRDLCAKFAAYRAQCSADAGAPGCAETLSTVDAARNRFNSLADSYNDAAADALQRTYKALDKKVAGDQNNIRSLNLHNDAAEFESWTRWLQDQDDQRLHQSEEAFKAAATSAALFKINDAIRLGGHAANALTPDAAERIIARCQAAGANDPLFLAAIRRFAAVKDKTLLAEAGVELLEHLKKAKALWDLHDLGPDQESAAWKTGDILLELFIPDPKIRLMGQLTLDEVRATFYTLWEAGVAFPVFDSQISSLEKLTTEHLALLRSASKQLEADVHARADAKKELKDIDNQPPEAICQ
jgi:hypothetical protein